MMARKNLLLAPAVAALLLLTGCTPTEPVTAPDAGTDKTPSAPATPADGPSIDRVTSCDQVEAAVAPYITGLVPDEGNIVDEWGVSCQWVPADDETDLANNRSVSVILTPLEAGTEKPVTTGITAMSGGAVHESSWLTAHGGVAYSLTLGADVAAAVATTVWLPDVEAQIAGGAWGDLPALDGPAAVEVVQQLLG